jgi:Domain of unknown function (DUF4331)
LFFGAGTPTRARGFDRWRSAMLKANRIRARSIAPVALGLSLGNLSLADIAADHTDLPIDDSVIERSADIADLYAWLSNDTDKLNLVLTVNPDAGPEAWFSSEVTYALAVSSSTALGEPQRVTTIVCKFFDAAHIECWAGDEYVIGDPRSPAGISSDTGNLRVFAGLRDDPFFLEAAGQNAALLALASGIDSAEFNSPDGVNGCPRLTDEQGAGLRDLLSSSGDGAAPENTFAGRNVLALVVQVERALLDTNGPILGAWASTYASPAR